MAPAITMAVGNHHELTQFNLLPVEILRKLEAKNLWLEELYEMDSREIGSLVGHPYMGMEIKKLCKMFPYIDMTATIQPITRTILKVHLDLDPQFQWSDRFHGSVEPWWIWVEDTDNIHIYHSEYFLLQKQQWKNKRKEPISLTFTIPIFEPLPSQYYIRMVSDRWLGAQTILPLSFKNLILPHQYPPNTDLLNLIPLPLSALHNDKFESLFSFPFFNPIQTQVFHVCYHTGHNVLLGAPTGSGKTVAAELAMLQIFRDTPHLKVVYIAPLKALVRERMKDWHEKFEVKLGKKLVELTGDFTPNIKALQMADIVTTTPEKWDGISRNWKTRSYVQSVGLVIIDEIHLLGEERGPVLEVIVSRMRYISSQTDNPVRIIGLSTAIANAQDLVDWLGIEGPGLYNFRPSVRPVPLEVHIDGYPGKHYCPRMATMNKPTYASIVDHSLNKPALVFVSSRRQTRLTALDLISFASMDENPRQWLHMSQPELDTFLPKIKDANLKHVLPFGIGLHHAGLCDTDRQLVEDLFCKVKIQVLVSTATLAWGVNLPAHLVVIKGTEYYDAKTKGYIDFPVTDVLQMMGRAGRPQFDTLGKVVILVEESKKNFYQKFLYEPFPVESSLAGVLHDHFNAEIVAGTITTKQDAVDYLTWTYYFRRLIRNPSYYGLEDASSDSLNKFLSNSVDDTIRDLEYASCVQSDGNNLVPLTLGRIGSFYYLRYTTMSMFRDSLGPSCDIRTLLDILCKVTEYDELPVRHNEDKINAQLAEEVPWAVDQMGGRMEDPHTKANLLLQAHFSNIALPITDYITDTKSVLDQAVRIIQAIVDVAADKGWLSTSLNAMHLLEMIMQGVWFTDNTLLSLPSITRDKLSWFHDELGVESIPELFEIPNSELRTKLQAIWSEAQIQKFMKDLSRIPQVDVNVQCPPAAEIGAEVPLKVTLTRQGKQPSPFAFAPRFPKIKQEAWWLVVGLGEELIALRRVTFATNTTASLLIVAPPEPGKYTYTVYIMSDSYIGINQQYEVSIDTTTTTSSSPTTPPTSSESSNTTSTTTPTTTQLTPDQLELFGDGQIEFQNEDL
ncbi:activating signal cointegrator 1 complex subunit 3 [Pelomyxa schiedti]|nr:activating signal cointegrator 1 complex subunit 3 [Pelomyxa schiedti]